MKKYVFLTAGACGPCRFGMYATEYRKALRDAGFDGFRVMLFQQKGGLKQATGDEAGLEMNPTFFLGLLRAIIAGDVINGMGYRLRPFEVEAGRHRPGASRRPSSDVYDALVNKRSRCWRRCGGARREFAADQVRLDPAGAAGVDHRRVLGDDHRGRRQLPAAALPGVRRAPSATSSSSPTGCCSCCGRAATTPSCAPSCAAWTAPARA